MLSSVSLWLVLVVVEFARIWLRSIPSEQNTVLENMTIIPVEEVVAPL